MKARPLTILRWTALATLAFGVFVTLPLLWTPGPDGQILGGDLAFLARFLTVCGFIIWSFLSALLIGVFWIDSLISKRRAV